MNQQILAYILARMQEASTVRGVVLLAAGGLGVALSQEKVDALVSFGLGLSGLLGVFLPDRIPAPKVQK